MSFNYPRGDSIDCICRTWYSLTNLFKLSFRFIQIYFHSFFYIHHLRVFVHRRPTVISDFIIVELHYSFLLISPPVSPTHLATNFDLFPLELNSLFNVLFDLVKRPLVPIVLLSCMLFRIIFQ